MSDDIFGEPIYSYSRRQAIADGVLVDITGATDANGNNLCKDAGITIPVAMTSGAWHETVVQGGTWSQEDRSTLLLPGGQSLTGRLWDVLCVLRVAMAGGLGRDRVSFKVGVDVNGDGKRTTVDLWALVGPGDTPAPVLTIMLIGED